MSLADSVDEGDLTPYERFNDWEAVEEEQRRRARLDREWGAWAVEEIQNLRMQLYIAHEFIEAMAELLDEKRREIEFLERCLEYEAWKDNCKFWAAVEKQRAAL